MNFPVSILKLSYAALASFIVLVLVLYIKKYFFSKWYLKPVWITVFSFVLVYFLIVSGSYFQDLYLKWQLSRFDLNHDGMFTDSEITEELKKAVREVSADNARRFAVVTGYLVARVVAIITFVFALSVSLFRRYSKEF